METQTIARYEIKYPIPAVLLPVIREHLLRYCDPDGNASGREWYPIQSLYFDNSRYQIYRDTEAKAPFRIKLRARAYGAGAGSFKIEVKRRTREEICKTSAVIGADLWERAGREGTLALAGVAGAAEFVRLCEGMRATPRMLIAYERLAFTSRLDDYVRVTFDRRMRYQHMTRWSVEGGSRLWRYIDDPSSIGEPTSCYILELKFARTAPEWLLNLVREFGLSRHGYSKYGRAMRRTLAERDPAWGFHPAFAGTGGFGAWA